MYIESRSGLRRPPPLGALNVVCVFERPFGATAAAARQGDAEAVHSGGAEERGKLTAGGPELRRGANPQALVGSQPGKPSAEATAQDRTTHLDMLEPRSDAPGLGQVGSITSLASDRSTRPAAA